METEMELAVGSLVIPKNTRNQQLPHRLKSMPALAGDCLWVVG